MERKGRKEKTSVCEDMEKLELLGIFCEHIKWCIATVENGMVFSQKM